MAHDPRRPSAAGKMTVRLDFRTRGDATKPNEPDRQHWNDLEDVVPVLVLLHELFGSDVEVLFDFGEIILRDVDLGALRVRLEEGSPDAS